MSGPVRIVVTGASGNVGTGVLRALARHHPAAEIVGVCRRTPTSGEVFNDVRWHAVDLSRPDAAEALAPAMSGADVVIHLALALYPVDDTAYLFRANVAGTQAVLRAMVTAGVRHLVYASSLGVYAHGPREPVPETWPATGQSSSTYSRHKVMVETILDEWERDHPDAVVSRFRPTVVVQRAAASMVSILYLGPWIPRAVLRVLAREGLPVMPMPKGLALQFVHADDLGEAVVALMTQRCSGSYNVAADVLDSVGLAALVGARPFPVGAGLARRAISALNWLGVVAVTPGWYDVATNTPLMDTTKLRDATGWTPARTSHDSARELIEGLADGAVGESPALGSNQEAPPMTVNPAVGVAHDASLGMWTALALTHAVRGTRPGVADAAVVATNLAAGTPAALARVLQRRNDPVALLAPVAVGAAVLTTPRGGWPPVVATAALAVMAMSERRRARR